MKAPAESPRTSGQCHAVRFYEDDTSLCRIVAEFLGDGLAAGEPAIAIAVPSHRDEIREQLSDLAFDVARLEAIGQLRLIDAEETMLAFMRTGTPDPVRFRATIGGLIDAAVAGRPNIALRAYGEMVDCLWKKDASVAAIKLEMLWNQLADTRAFSLLCGYSMGNFYKHGAYENICSQHTHVVSGSGQITRMGVA